MWSRDRTPVLSSTTLPAILLIETPILLQDWNRYQILIKLGQKDTFTLTHTLFLVSSLSLVSPGPRPQIKDMILSLWARTGMSLWKMTRSCKISLTTLEGKGFSHSRVTVHLYELEIISWLQDQHVFGMHNLREKEVMQFQFHLKYITTIHICICTA